jgi:hypothetical protein
LQIVRCGNTYPLPTDTQYTARYPIHDAFSQPSRDTSWLIVTFSNLECRGQEYVRDRETFRKRIGFCSDKVGQLRHLNAISSVYVRLSCISLLHSRFLSMMSIERRVQGQTETKENVVFNIAIEVVVGDVHRNHRHCIGDT